ncbi:MAG: TolB family protein, partial [Dehalococcoidia bacterium]
VWEHQTPGESIEGLAWAPSGEAIYLSLLTPEVRDGRLTDTSLRLFRLDLASGALTPIVDDAAYPDVSPDNSRIAFVTFSSGSGPAGIWTAAPDGSDRRLIVPVPETFAGVRWPRFSPDGARIAFGAVETAAANDMPLPCDQRTRLPWQPRTAAAHGPPIDIWSVATTGGTSERFPDLREDDPYIAWSPDGSSLAVIGACGLYLLPAGGGASQRIAPGTARSQIDWR